MRGLKVNFSGLTTVGTVVLRERLINDPIFNRK